MCLKSMLNLIFGVFKRFWTSHWCFDNTGHHYMTMRIKSTIFMHWFRRRGEIIFFSEKWEQFRETRAAAEMPNPPWIYRLFKTADTEWRRSQKQRHGTFLPIFFSCRPFPKPFWPKRKAGLVWFARVLCTANGDTQERKILIERRK